ncbi:MAG: TraB/GumN family protein [Porphyrobacter sp.]|jgi:hypothetical protein|nr:TraB/GumN family protein [Porphyrobacter sp.]
MTPTWPRRNRRSKASQWLGLAAAWLSATLGLALGACSNDADGDDSESTRASPPFYEIARADGTASGWLLGTIHALPDDTHWRTPAIAQAVSEADVLVVEVASLKDRAATGRVFQELAVTPGLPPLTARISANLDAETARLADAAGLSEQQQRRTESWAAALMLARINATGDPGNGVDRALIGDFTDRPVRELEGVRGQLGLFDRLPEDAQRALLAAVITGAAQGTSEAEALRAAWLTGDVAALEAASMRGIMADPVLRETLLVARNRRWLAQIETHLQLSGKPLIAVGAAHLVGPDGLVALLEAHGWRVTRRI